MSLRERLANLVLARLGLDFDFTLDLRRRPVSEISETFAVGSRPGTEDLDTLRDAGVTHIITCLPESERAGMAFLGEAFEWLFLPLRDSIDEDIARAFPAAFAFADAARASRPGARVLVHCEVGVSRSAIVALALLMRDERLGFYDAYLNARARRPEILPNIGFASQLQALEESLAGDTRGGEERTSLARYLREICHVPAEIELIEEALGRHRYDAPRAIEAIFGGEIPRVVQGVRR